MIDFERKKMMKNESFSFTLLEEGSGDHECCVRAVIRPGALA